MIETERGILFFDTETTGILKDESWKLTSNWSLIQLAYRKLENWNKKDKNMFFNTNTTIEVWSMAVHGIYKELLLEKTWGEYINDTNREELSSIFNENIIVAHHIEFDADVLNKSWISFTDNQIDTLKVAKILWSEGFLKNSKWNEPEYVNLQYLRYFFELYKITDENWKVECTTAHDAFWDVVVLENVFYNLFDIIKKELKINDTEVLDKMIEMTKKEFILIKTMRVGKYRGKTFEDVSNMDKWYLEWMLKADFTEDIKYTCKVWLGKIEDTKFFNN